MKGLNELVADCNNAVKDYIALKEEDEKLKADLKEIVLKNWQIVKASVADFEQIRKMLVNYFAHNNAGMGNFTFTYDKGVTLYISSDNKFWINALDVRLNLHGKQVDYINGNLWENDRPFADSAIPVWGELLRTEEDANNVVEAISQYYVKVMEYYLNEVIPLENTKMRESIQNVKSLLSDSHTVEEKEDGTVEIRLGGKTYIGTLKEE